MSRGHWRLVIVLGVVSVWYGAFGHTFHPVPFVMGLAEMLVGWFFLLVDVEIRREDVDNDDDPKNNP